MLVLDGNIPRFPWEPSTTMLTNRLGSTTEDFGVLPGRTPPLWPLAGVGAPRHSGLRRAKAHRIFARHGEHEGALRC
jgi:hypothetical protein